MTETTQPAAATPYRLMYDSVSPNLIPVSAPMVAGYRNGIYAWKLGIYGSRWPGKPHIQVDVNGSAPQFCDVLDVENGDATLAMCAAWITARIPYGRACIYTGLSNLTALSKALKSYKAVDCWVASWDDSVEPVSVPSNLHLVAKQHTNTPNFDISAVYDTAWPLGEVK